MAAASLLFGQAPAGASGPGLVPGGPELRVNRDPEALRQHYDHTLAVNPALAGNYVVTSSLRWNSTCFVHTSFDGGSAWASRPLEMPQGASSCGLSSAAFDRQGTLYVAYNANTTVTNQTTGQSSVVRRLFLARSIDGGLTFDLNKDLGVPSVFSTAIAIDTSGGARDGTVYLAFIPDGRPPNRRATVFSTSDRGATLSAPVTVAPITEQVTGRVHLDVGPGGEVYLAYQDFTEAFAQLAGFILGATVIAGPFADNPDIAPMSAHVARSTDGGRTFSNTEVDDALGGGIVANVQSVVPLPVVAVDPTDGNRAYLVVTDRRRGGDWDVYFYRTTDGGTTWTEPRRLNDDPLEPRTDQVMPWIDVAPNGRVDVVWLDRREDPGNRFARAWGASSSDAGASWTPNRPLSSVAFDASIGSLGQGSTSYLGDRLALHSTVGGGYVIWPDTREGTEESGTNDLYGRAVNAAGPN